MASEICTKETVYIISNRNVLCVIFEYNLMYIPVLFSTVRIVYDSAIHLEAYEMSYKYNTHHIIHPSIRFSFFTLLLQYLSSLTVCILYLNIVPYFTHIPYPLLACLVYYYYTYHWQATSSPPNTFLWQEKESFTG